VVTQIATTTLKDQTVATEVIEHYRLAGVAFIMIFALSVAPFALTSKSA